MNIRVRAFVEGFSAGIAFGTASIFVRYLIIFNVNIYAIAFLRLAIASFLLIFIGSLLIPEEFKLIFYSKNLIWKIVIMGLLIGLHFIFFIASVKDTFIVNATILVNTTPILAMLIGYIIFRVSFDKLDVMTVFMAFLGSLLLVIQDFRLSGSIIGDLEALLAALLLAMYVNVGRLIRGFGNVLLNMSIVYLVAVPVVYVISIFSGTDIMDFSLDIGVITLLLAVGTIPTALGHTLYISSLKGLKPFEAATLALLEPVFASILALILFEEVPSVLSLLGGFIVLFSVLLISYRRNV